MLLSELNYLENGSIFDDPELRWKMLRFGKGDTTDRLIDDIVTAETVRSFEVPEGQEIAGALFLDLASRDSLEDQERATYLATAREIWQGTVEEWSTPEHLDHDVLRAAMNLIYLASRESLLMTGKLPNKEEQDALGQDLAALARDGVEHFHRLSWGAKPKGLTSGFLSELVPLMLVHRFASTKLRDGSMLAIPSLFTEDRTWYSRSEAATHEPWDMSTYTQDGTDNAVLTYKLQVKSRDNEDSQVALDYRKYTHNEVPTLTIRDDLAVTSQELSPCHRPGNNYKRGIVGVQPSLIIQELLREVDGTASDDDIHNLEERTEKVLDILDT